MEACCGWAGLLWRGRAWTQSPAAAAKVGRGDRKGAWRKSVHVKAVQRQRRVRHLGGRHNLCQAAEASTGKEQEGGVLSGKEAGLHAWSRAEERAGGLVKHRACDRAGHAGLGRRPRVEMAAEGRRKPLSRTGQM